MWRNTKMVNMLAMTMESIFQTVLGKNWVEITFILTLAIVSIFVIVISSLASEVKRVNNELKDVRSENLNLTNRLQYANDDNAALKEQLIAKTKELAAEKSISEKLQKEINELKVFKDGVEAEKKVKELKKVEEKTTKNVEQKATKKVAETKNIKTSTKKTTEAKTPATAKKVKEAEKKESKETSKKDD
jgi:outer membrane biosynthesis protein TonB